MGEEARMIPVLDLNEGRGFPKLQNMRNFHWVVGGIDGVCAVQEAWGDPRIRCPGHSWILRDTAEEG